MSNRYYFHGDYRNSDNLIFNAIAGRFESESTFLAFAGFGAAPNNSHLARFEFDMKRRRSPYRSEYFLKYARNIVSGRNQRFYFHGDYRPDGLVFNRFTDSFVSPNEFLKFDDFTGCKGNCSHFFRFIFDLRLKKPPEGFYFLKFAPNIERYRWNPESVVH